MKGERRIEILKPTSEEGEGSSARNSSARKICSTPKSRLLHTVRADDKNIRNCSKVENQKSMPYVLCRADASFRPKLTTARIASARQKIKKMSTAQQYF
jgi:hypothetical protein